VFSVTDEPWVTSGGTSALLSRTRHDSTLTYQDNGWAFIGRTRRTRSVMFIHRILTSCQHCLPQLYARRGSVPTSDDVVDPRTTFKMMLREPGPIPATFDLTCFLVSSITFMTHLTEVCVYFDDKRLVRLSKNRGRSKAVPMLNGLEGTSPEGMMNVESIETMREFCCDFWKNLSIAPLRQPFTLRWKWFDGCTMLARRSLPLHTRPMP